MIQHPCSELTTFGFTHFYFLGIDEEKKKTARLFSMAVEEIRRDDHVESDTRLYI
jgi:hypothetical protein